MIEFFSGAVTTAYLLVGICFFKCWKRTHDLLFMLFAIAFGLFALNQVAAIMTNTMDERTGCIYLLRILGYGTILFAIVDKNTFSSRKP